ncbi:MAG: type III-B CRISPR-associated protein Cas10/Cmr2, partial [Candidatus Binatia bacterium]
MSLDGNLAHRGIALVKAWLHDPPSKALGIQGHEARTRRLLELVVGPDEALRAVEMTKDDDVFAAITERLPMPTAGASGERAVKPADGIVFVHPLSGTHRPLEIGQLHPEIEEAIVSDIVAKAGDSAWVRFLALWRCLPDRLAARHPDWALVPADTRQPDHTIFHHLDMAAAFETAGPGAPLLSFSIGPVQSFIAAARTLRDLWSGSLLLSKLTFAAMRPVLTAVGPQAFVYPSPRRIPDVDVWLREQGVPEVLVRKPDLGSLLLPAIPNRFLAIVPAGSATELAEKCETAVRQAWLQIASDVRNRLHDRLGAFDSWDARWSEQIKTFWEIRTSLLPRKKLDDELRSDLLGGLPEKADQVRRLAEAIPENHRYSFEQKHAGRWAADVALSARIAEAAREVAHFRSDPAEGEVPPKCTLFGELEQVGPPGLDASRRFWELAREKLVIDGLRLRDGERLSAVGLIRRFWPAAALGKLLNEKVWSEDTRIADTATVAARIWLREAGIDPTEWRDWNGTWVFDDAPQDEDEAKCPAELRAKLSAARRSLGKAPPRYFAVLHMDGDHLGWWLRGELAPTIAEALHPKTREYFESLG